ncbi:MAG TPA: fibronectin type III domain-containing protein [Verrucomicrobiae bacterium]
MKHICFLIALLALLVGRTNTEAGSVVLDWSPGASTAATGYNVYYGTNSGNYAYKLNAGSSTNFTIPNLAAGVTYYFAATSYDANGNESTYSTETTYLVPGVVTMTPSSVAGAPPTIQFPVAPGKWYEVQASTDMKNWASVAQTDVVAANIWMQYSDPYASNYPSRFYRIVEH